LLSCYKIKLASPLWDVKSFVAKYGLCHVSPRDGYNLVMVISHHSIKGFVKLAAGKWAIADISGKHPEQLAKKEFSLMER
jgi:hypothetical protein